MTTPNNNSHGIQLLTNLTTLIIELQAQLLLPDPPVLGAPDVRHREWKAKMGKKLASLPPSIDNQRRRSYMASRTTGEIHKIVNQNGLGDDGEYLWNSPGDVFKALDAEFL
ncbi:hypothetical protein PMZ80_008924 [Knufia obscura]|uniref:Uncharacterized protein n=1 Tax=Knufia obscura TaxID=1635080 RepID=A0ABR0RDM1_9EURO|nr:hypothetical protein PMZ80_008924 [Knufia obscura]